VGAPEEVSRKARVLAVPVRRALKPAVGAAAATVTEPVVLFAPLLLLARRVTV